MNHSAARLWLYQTLLRLTDSGH